MNKPVLGKPPQLALAHPSLFTKLELDLYEKEILANPKATELDASKFFARYPKFLFLGVGKEIRREVALIDSSDSEIYRVDFFRKSYGEKYWDIIELKTPKAHFISKPRKEHPKFSAEVDNAINQALNYRDSLILDAEMRSKLLEKGILVYYPQILVIVGKNNELVPPETMRILYDRVRQMGPLEVKSYNDIYDFAKENYERNSVIIIPGQIGETREELSEDVLAFKTTEEAIKSIVGSREYLDKISLSIAQFDFRKNFIVISHTAQLSAQLAIKIAEKYARTFELPKKLGAEAIKQYMQTWNLATESAKQMILFHEMMSKQLINIAPILKSTSFRFKPLP